MTKVAEAVQEYWNEEGAKVYDRIHYMDEERLKNTLLRHLDNDKDSVILDFGTGTGFMASLLAKAGYKRLIGLDINPHMLKIAKKKLGAYPALLLRGDGFHLPLKDNSVDAVVSKWVLWVLPDPEQAIKEMVRVTKPGGKIIALDSDKHEHQKKSPLLKRLIKQCHSLGIILSAGASPFRTKRFWEKTKGKLPRYTLEKYRDIFQKQGLEVAVDQEEEYGNPQAKLLYDGFKLFLIEGTKPAVWDGDPAPVDDEERGDLSDLLVCPECRGRLSKQDEPLFFCESCRKAFPLWEGIPDLMPDADKLL